MSLYPTPTRLRRLREVEAGDVCRYGDRQDYDPRGCKVTSAVAELERAGWIRLGEPQPVKTLWQLTDAGKAVLHG